jgi:hypothetical protein
MTDFTRRVPARLRVLQANGYPATGKVTATVAMVPLACARDVDGLGLVAPLDWLPLLRRYRR